MKSTNRPWTRIQREEGLAFLEWLGRSRALEVNCSNMRAALLDLQYARVRTAQDAREVWDAVPAVLAACNEQETYELPGAASAYAWLHHLDRYLRTWAALETLVRAECAAMAKDGVNTLDVGTGPGPSAFAIHDFYSAMVAYAGETQDANWLQPAHLACVEIDQNTNSFRHQLAEVLFEKSQRRTEGVLAMCRSLHDFNMLRFKSDRREYLRSLNSYFDPDEGGWVDDPWFDQKDANREAQRLHRYRLFVFSNFLTTPGFVNAHKAVLREILIDARPGAVALLIGGKSGDYPDVYDAVREISESAGFVAKVSGERVSAESSGLAREVFDAGREFYGHLQSLSPDRSGATEEVRRYFEGDDARCPSSHIWAFRKL